MNGPVLLAIGSEIRTERLGEDMRENVREVRLRSGGERKYDSVERLAGI